MRSCCKSLSTVPGILGPIFIKSGLPGYISSSASDWWHTPYLVDVHKIRLHQGCPSGDRA